MVIIFTYTFILISIWIWRAKYLEPSLLECFILRRCIIQYVSDSYGVSILNWYGITVISSAYSESVIFTLE